MIWSIAWRNVWRNKVRSIIVLSAVAIGLFAGVFSTGFYKGMSDMRLKTALKTEVSHIQIHHPDYRLNNDLVYTIDSSNSIVNKILEMPSVEGVCRRVKAQGMLYTAHGNRMISLNGIEPEKEMMVTDVYERLVDGNYFETRSKRNPPILIGEKLANKLKVHVKSKITIQVVDKYGNITAKQFKVCGIFKTANTGFDEMNAFVLFDDLKSQLSLEGEQAHEIAVYHKTGVDVLELKKQIEEANPGYEVLYWKEISKELALMTDMMDKFLYIFVLIILLALCFGIINTMLMVVLERVKELGMLMAVGMNRMRVFWMIILESVYLSFTGGILGIGIGYVVIKYFEKRPISLDMFKGFEQYGYSSDIYTNIPFETIVVIAIMVVILGILSAIYPARKATKLDPAEAVRSE